LFSIFLKILLDKDGNSKTSGLLIKEVIRIIAYSIYRYKKYSDEFLLLSKHPLYGSAIIKYTEELKNEGFIYNTDKDGIPIWNSRKNSSMTKYLEDSKLLNLEFLKIWGNRNRYMNNRLYPTLDVARTAIALKAFTDKYPNFTINDILSATSSYLDTFMLQNGGYAGLSNAENFISKLLSSYIEGKVQQTTRPNARYNATSGEKYYDDL